MKLFFFFFFFHAIVFSILLLLVVTEVVATADLANSRAQTNKKVDGVGHAHGSSSISYHSNNRYIHRPRMINCNFACGRRCRASSRKKICVRACGGCCRRCKCVPPGTYGNHAACPCYASLRTHGNRLKCP